jgi:hypothetical protein
LGGLFSGTSTPSILQLNNPTSPGGSHGSDQKWGDPMSTDLLDSDHIHARLNYFAGSANGGTQTGVGISLSFPE